MYNMGPKYAHTFCSARPLQSQHRDVNTTKLFHVQCVIPDLLEFLLIVHASSAVRVSVGVDARRIESNIALA